ncbi:MAG: protein phosphatase 2C domain-containing protein [Clostridiales bacterium]|nr:protein phosphatase 2C domain-containing protein [Clostridiales bacterium]
MEVKKLSRKGSYHTGRKEENQDFVFFGCNKDFYALCLADGVSACKEAKKGAETAAVAITDLFLKAGQHFFEFENEQAARLIAAHVLYELKEQAAEGGEDVKEYSAAAASVLVDRRRNKILCFSLGDCMIMAAGGGKCRVVCPPSDSTSGCCVTTTENAAEMISLKIYDAAMIDSVVICSDGAWKHMFEKNNRLKTEAAGFIINNEYDKLGKFLIKQNSFDDYSFISLDMRRKKRRKSA